MRPGANFRCRTILIAAALAAFLWLALASAFAQERARSIAVVFQSWEGVRALCGMLMNEDARDVIACSNPGVMVLPDPALFPNDRYACIVAHERDCHVMSQDTYHLTARCRRRC